MKGGCLNALVTCVHKHLNFFSQHVTASCLAGHLYTICLHMLVLLFVLKEKDSGMGGIAKLIITLKKKCVIVRAGLGRKSASMHAPWLSRA